MSSTAADISPGRVLGGVYTVTRKLGEGGMGAVFAVSRGETQFALKLLLAGAHDPQTVARFMREAEVAQSVRSPYLVPVIDVGYDHELRKPYLVMPLLAGRDLEQQARLGVMHPTVAARLFSQAAQGLVALHGAGVVHRDIKPANVFLDIRDGVVEAKITDFGVAKVLDEAGLTRTGQAMGTPYFMAPEQLADAKHVDPRADLWSLGMTLYQALSGELPFGQLTSFTELFTCLMSRDIPLLHEKAPWLDPALVELVHALLLRDVALRCPSAAELYDALAPFTGGTTEVSEAMLAPMRVDATTAHASLAGRPASWSSRRREVPRSSVLDPRIGQLVGRKFTLRKLLGQGGMGAVYLAEGPAGPVAVKVMSMQIAHDAAALRRFVREARAAMSIDSPHVVRVVDADTDPSHGAPYIAMELLEGEDIEQLVRRVGPLEPAVAARLFAQACKGLEAAHALGIVHRDIKPANLFLQRGSAITVKVCDFGVAKNTATPDGAQQSVDLTRTGGMLGSPLYMSPEQARSAKNVDARSDVWSLCMSMHEALTGSKPWKSSTSIGDLVLAICTTDAPAVQDLAPWVEPELADIVHRGLRREPDARFPSIAELRAALTHFAGDAPVTERDLTPLDEGRRGTVAPRSTSFASAQSTAGTTSSVDPQPRRSAAPLLAVGVAAIAVIAGVTLVSRQQPAAPASPASSPPPAPSAPARITARVRVTPRDARVAIGDRPALLGPGGVLLVEGAAGEQVEITAEAGDQQIKTRVRLVAEGVAEPSTIEVPTATSVQPSAHPSQRPAPTAKGPGKGAPAPQAPQTAQPQPTAAPPPDKPKVAKEFE